MFYFRNTVWHLLNPLYCVTQFGRLLYLPCGEKADLYQIPPGLLRESYIINLL